MHNSDVNLENPRSAKPFRPGGQPAGVHWTRTDAGRREGIRILGTTIAQTALQSIGMSTKDPWGPPIRLPEYALAVSLIFTKATNQTIILNTPPDHVRSTSILWSNLAHDKRFEQVPMSEAAPGDIIIGPGWQQGADGYAGIIVNHGRIVSNSSQGVQDNSSLSEIQRSHPAMVAFRYVGFWNYYRSKSLANAGFNADESRLPAGQPGGGQWTSGMAPSTTVLSGRNTLLSDEFNGPAGIQQGGVAPAKTSQSVGDAAQVHKGQWRVPGTGTIDQLKQARQKLDEGYAKEVEDIKNMPGISDQERNAALKSLEEKYQKARDDLDRRISRIEQTARDMAFAYGGKPSDYYKILDDSDPKVQELMDALDHLDSYGFKDQALLYLRHAMGGKSPPPTDPHVLNAALAAAMAMLGERGGAEPVNKGKEGVEQSVAEAVAAGEKVKGKEVTFELPSGNRTRSDLLTENDEGLKVREAKKGPSAKLSSAQTEMQRTSENGGSVIPRGANAKAAGLEPGKPIKIPQHEVDHH